MASCVELLNEFNVVCTRADGRDKLARIAQYLARSLFGITTWMEPTAGSRLSEINLRTRYVMTELGSARRTHRWCKEFPVIQSLPKSFRIKNPVDRVLEISQKVSLIVFLICDHVSFLQQLQILKGGKRAGVGIGQLGLKFVCFSHLVSAIVHVKQFSKKIRSTDARRSAADRQKHAIATLKYLLLVLQTAHLSSLYQSHDAVVGVAGAITGYIDLMAQWPERRSALVTVDAGRRST
eukprot:TRINITY_DN35589_c0_g1_i1.p1 TRINITY_DN35589_c0_g1~~TRINITY_DN35589_c0_g1_i1.p1  ORF type:complete len:237 (+),score=18.07 TRINITY_DN35589_c0_g1_i1:105-815(+)